MSFTHYINGQQVPEPLGWREFAQEIDRDRDKRTISVKYPGTAEFTKSTYALLRALFIANDCTIVQYEAWETCGDSTILILRADIILADCKWNLARCTVECSLVDDGIGARISNNLKVPVSPLSPKTKNGDALTPAPRISLRVFDPATGTYGTTRYAFDWLACMQHAVRYITDSNVTLVSQWYSNLPDEERLAITSGFQLRTGSPADGDDRVVYNFEDLFLEISKKYNLWMMVQRDLSGNPFVVVEPEEALYSTTTAATFLHTDNLIQSIDREQLWATVRVGSSTATKNQGGGEAALPFLVLQGYSEEFFHFEAVCNTDAQLDLVGKWVTCANTIERILDNNSEYDEDIVVVQYDRSTDEAVASDWYNPGGLPVLYNEQMLNINVLNRYSLPSNVGVFYASQDAAFQALSDAFGTPYSTTSTLGTTTSPVTALFPTEVSDPGGNYTPNDYTAPIQGYYVFNVLRRWQVTENTFGVSFFNIQKRAYSKIIVQRFDAFNVLVQQVEFRSTNNTSTVPNVFTPVGNYVHQISQGFNLNAGDYVRVQYAWGTTSSGDILLTGTIAMRDVPMSEFGTTFVATGGGVLTNVDPNAARVVTLEFERITTAAQWERMTSDPTLAVVVGEAAYPRVGNILSASRNLYKGTTSYTLIAKRSDR
jgi:hypothetical protein